MKKQTKLGLVLAAAAVLSVSVASLVSARGWVQRGSDWYYTDNDGEALTDTIQTSGTAKFYLGEDGTMQRDYFLEDYDGATYYFGSNGAMVTNTWVAVESSRVENQGDRTPDNYWYYFQASGKAMKGTSGNPKRTTIDGRKYAFNEYGQMLTGWITQDGALVSDDEDNPYETATYYAGGENDGVLRTGWVTYYDGYVGDEDWLNDKGNLYFYFNTTNNRKIGYDGNATTKKINGRTYAFASTGVMVSGWDVVNSEETGIDISSLANKTVYFSGDDDGHQVKRGWIYVVPASRIDEGAYDDGEEKYMYFNSSGVAVTDSIKKINGKYYVFNANGIMKTGLVMWAPTGMVGRATQHYVDVLDLDWAKGEDYSKKGILTVDSGENDYYKVEPNGIISRTEGRPTTAQYAAAGGTKVKVHYFGDDGARRTGSNTIEFSDETYTFVSNNSGDKGSGVFSKKYYSLGILLKASADVRYGIYAQAATMAFLPQEAGNRYVDHLYSEGKGARVDNKTAYLVLTTSGTKLKGAKSAKRDADGNYWVVDNNNSYLRGIFTVNVKYASSTFSFTGEGNTDLGSSTNAATARGIVDGNLATLGFDADVWNSQPASGAKTVESFTTTKHSATGQPDWFTYSMKYSGYWFQSDYGDSSNKWIPFGVYDASGRTASFEFDGDNPSDHFQVEPNDDYFLNCYYSA